MRLTICAAVAAATAVVSAHHSFADKRMVASNGGSGPTNQKPLMQGGPEEKESYEDLLNLIDLEGLSLSSGKDVDFQGIQGCATCETLLVGLKAAAIKGDDTFVNAVTKLCKRLEVQDADVCEGSIAQEGPIAAHALRGMTLGSRTSRLFCVATLGFCSYPGVEAEAIAFPSPKPPPGAGRPPPSGREREPLRVVHYSDIHVDPFYAEGANANCSKPICCRNYTATDPPSEHDVPAGRNGDHKCDAPVSLEDSMHAAIARLVPGAAFSIFTGDVVDHAVWNTTVAQNTLDIEDAYARMSGAGLLVYGTAGNHESSPTNSFPPASAADGGDDAGSGGGGAQWLYDLLSSAWGRWVGPEAAVEARAFGAYSAKHRALNGTETKLRVLSLNTNLFYRHNLWLYEEPMQQDPSGQLAWLVEELDAAERAGERVWIIGHMPLGSADAFHDASNYLDQIVNRYEGTIAALFFGHTHHDEFQISYSDYENRNHTNAVAMSYIAPSLTPMSGHPSFRVYDVDPVTFGILDVTTYIANMSDPDFHTSPKGPTWKKYYSAREAYGPLVSPPAPATAADVGELTPAFWHNVTEVLARDTTAFAGYLDRKRRGWRVGDEVEDCAGSGECRGAEICRLRGARAQDNCARPRSKLWFGRRGPAGVKAEADECEVSVVRDTLAGLGLVVRALAGA